MWNDRSMKEKKETKKQKQESKDNIKFWREGSHMGVVLYWK
jgi:hypothetical protein